MRVHHWCADWILFPIVYHLVRYRRKMVAKNLALAFPEKSETERRQIARAFYHQFCDTFVESIYGYSCSEEEMRKRVVFDNMDEVNRRVAEHGGAILMLGHVGNWEWMASAQAWLAPGVTQMNIYRRQKNQSIDRLMLAIRAKRDGICVEKQRILREMIRYKAEKKPITVGLISDQKPRPEVTRTWVKFLHQEVGFLDGGEVLSKKFGYPVFYYYITRTARGYYHVDMRPIEMNPQKTEEGEITKAFARALEENIKEQPDLWLWTHNRFKYRKNEV